jgi:acyl carrier protein
MAATQSAAASQSKERVLYLPGGCDYVRFYEPPSDRVWSHVILRTGGGSNTSVIEFDVRLLNDMNRLIAEIFGFRLLSVTPSVQGVIRAQSDSRLYQVQWCTAPWQKVPLASDDPELSRRWLILADRGGIGGTVAKLLETKGRSCRVFKYEKVVDVGGDPNERVRQLLQVQLDSNNDRLLGVVHLWGLDSAPPDAVTGHDLEQVQIFGCNTVLSLIQALISRGAAMSTRIWLVTRGAQPVETGDQLSVLQAPLWGLGKVINFEHPDLRCTCLDLDPSSEPEGAAELLLREFSAGDEEDQVAFRNGDRYLARILPSSLTETVISCSCRTSDFLREDGSYLITGGLGGLGLTVALWMVEQGAKHLTLASRSGDSAAAQALVHELRQRGINVLTTRTDLTHWSQLEALLIQIRKQMPRLRGIIHAAGVIDDGALVNLNAHRLSKVMAPKVSGTWNLHAATADLPLDFFVLFSSAVSVLGSPGQANYAAANAFLDAMAHYRQSRGLPAISINWGPWSEVGLAASTFERLKAVGSTAPQLVKLISVKQGLEALRRLLVSSIPQVMVLPFDLKDLVKLYPSAARMPLFKEVGGKESHLARYYERPNLSQKHVEPRNELERKLAGIWQQSLHIDRVGVQDSFFELGGDSVLGIQIITLAEKTFGVAINVGEALGSLTIEYLARIVESELINKLEAMSEEEVQQLSGEVALER